MISACMTVSVRELRTAVREWACCFCGLCSGAVLKVTRQFIVTIVNVTWIHS